MVYLEFRMSKAVPDCSDSAPVIDERAVAFSWAPYCLSRKRRQLMSDEALTALLTLAYHNLAMQVTKVHDVAHAWKQFSETLVAFLAFTDIRDLPSTSNYYQYWHGYGIKFAEDRFVEGHFRPSVWEHNIRPSPPCYLIQIERRSVIPPEHDLRVLMENNAASAASGTAVAVPAPTGSTEDIGILVPERADDHESVCLICITKPPVWVMVRCGHLGLCDTCRNAVYLAQNAANKGRVQLRKHINLPKLLRELVVQCPFCRAKTRTIHHREVGDKVYVCCRVHLQPCD